MTSTLADPVGTPPPSPRPSRPPSVPEGDRRTALAWMAGGFTSASMAARAADPSAFDFFRTPEGIASAVGGGKLGRDVAAVLAPGDGLASEMAAGAARRAVVMAELEAQGWTPETAAAALGMPAPRSAA